MEAEFNGPAVGLWLQTIAENQSREKPNAFGHSDAKTLSVSKSVTLIKPEASNTGWWSQIANI